MYLHTLCQVTLYINVHYIIMCKIKVLLDCLYVYKVLAGLDNVESTKKNNFFDLIIVKRINKIHSNKHFSIALGLRLSTPIYIPYYVYR